MSKEQIDIKINVESSEAQREISRLAERELKKLEGSLDDTAKAVVKVEEKFSGFGASVADVGKKIFFAKAAFQQFASVTTGVAAKLGQAAVRGEQFAKALANSNVSVHQAQRATAGLVDQLTLAQSSAKAVALGVNVTKEQFNSLAASATKASQVMGTTAPKALDDLITALGRGSTQILDNLGISLKLNEAYQIYAERIGKTADELTDLEKKTAFQTVALERLEEAFKNVELETGGAGQQFQRMNIAFQDLLTNFGRFVNNSSIIGNGFKFIADNVSSLLKELNLLQAEFKTLDKRVTDRKQLVALQAAQFDEILRLEALGVPTDKLLAIMKRQDQKLRAFQNKQVAGRNKFFNKFFAGSKQAGLKAGAGALGKRGGRAGAAEAFSPFLESELEKQRTSIGGVSTGVFAGVESQAFSQFQSELELRKALTQAAKTQKQAVDELGQAQANNSKQTNDGLNATVALMETMGGVMFDALMQAARGTKSFGAAFKEMTSQVIASLGKEFAIRAAGETAKGVAALFFNPLASGAHFKAAGLYAAAAALAGTAAAALAPTRGAQKSTSSRTTRGLGGGQSEQRGAGGQSSFTFNINTMLAPSREDEYAQMIAMGVNQANAKGFL